MPRAERATPEIKRWSSKDQPEVAAPAPKRREEGPKAPKKAIEAGEKILEETRPKSSRAEAYLKRIDQARAEMAKLEAKQEAPGLSDMKHRVIMEQMAEQERVIGSLAFKLVEQFGDDLEDKTARELAKEADEWKAKQEEIKKEEAKGDHPLKGWKFRKEHGVVKAHPPEEKASAKAEKIRAKMKERPEMAEALSPGLKKAEEDSVAEAFFEGKVAKTPHADRAKRIEEMGARVDRTMEAQDRIAALLKELDRLGGSLKKLGVDVEKLSVSRWSRYMTDVRGMFGGEIKRLRSEYDAKNEELGKLGNELAARTGLSKEGQRARQLTLMRIRNRISPK
ncbi:hypothetical protein A2856_03010 [Candidatus Uhrbacteria bacterium RIFCSPHIGHO2_01_FULL_63_20]|uniref:Uncharacterized protein n=1 Tax=Candidatus Uhrbacteria bacterium RIFCSPHIGHO2_01_FULL_63_20 TaxID=1802385 RepID=A0A1F7TL58_9BACT|nr:MAG: hypothetical protein A2856_03010 [Candidatus Uhrbacteria bacterium RIFCSPHIGHO2_01_FULL_63_20]